MNHFGRITAKENISRLGDRIDNAKQERDRFRSEEARYTVILHSVRKKFGLSNNEYVMADTIHKLSGNHAPVPGWCSARKEVLGRSVGVSRQSAHAAIKKLVDKGLVMAHPSFPHLRTTEIWYNAVEVVRNARQSAG